MSPLPFTRSRGYFSSVARGLPMNRITRITNARFRGMPGLHDIAIDAAGRISAITPTAAPTQKPSAGRQPDAASEIDAGGHLVLPSFIDVHLHLDLAYSLDLVPENKSGTLIEAIRLYA